MLRSKFAFLARSPAAHQCVLSANPNHLFSVQSYPLIAGAPGGLVVNLATKADFASSRPTECSFLLVHNGLAESALRVYARFDASRRGKKLLSSSRDKN